MMYSLLTYCFLVASMAATVFSFRGIHKEDKFEAGAVGPEVDSAAGEEERELLFFLRHENLDIGEDVDPSGPFGNLWNTLSASKKQEILFQEVEKTMYDADNRLNSFDPSLLDLARFAFGADTPAIFTHDLDTHLISFPRGKTTHPNGGVSKIVWNCDMSTTKEEYTGLFRETSVLGLARFSQVMPGDQFSVAVKLFRDKEQSSNFVSMTLDPTETFFSANFSNHALFDQDVSGFRARVGLRVLQRGTNHQSPASMVGLSNLALRNADGREVQRDEVNFPWSLTLRPNSELNGTVVPIGPRSEGDMMSTLGVVQEGTKVFDVLAASAPGAEPEKICEIKTMSPILSSSFGDRFLFFRHQLMTDDLVDHAEWTERVNRDIVSCPFLKD